MLLFSHHLTLVHQASLQLICPGDCVVDATCGRGRDTLFLAQQSLAEEIWSLDIQEVALEATRTLLEEKLLPEQLARVRLLRHNHMAVPEPLLDRQLRLVLYNLGYLPGSDKSCVTSLESTLKSVEAFSRQIASGGALSLLCYVGHPGGKEESEALLVWASQLSQEWVAHCHRRLNAPLAPVWLLLQRR